MSARARLIDQHQLGFGFLDAPDGVALVPSVCAPAADAARPWESDASDDSGDEASAADAAVAAERFLGRLQSLGLRHVQRLVFTHNRSVLVSVKGFELRVHEAFADAPLAMQEQIVRFVMARRKWERQAARDAIVAFPLPRHRTPARAPERTHPEDEPLAERLAEWHTRFNGDRFGASLKPVPIRVSRRMLRRLGHYAPGIDGTGPEIALSARHLRRDGFAAALETLLHEMVHQWQHESGLPLGHDFEFRRKCREVGALASAKRAVC